MATNIYLDLITHIIDAQSIIVGPVAQKIADQVEELKSNPNKSKLEELVMCYEKLFGQASVETCKEAISKLNLTDVDLPDILK